jgi:hypothetical protein
VSDQPRDATLEGLLELVRQVTRDDLRVALPGRVTAYDAAKQRASVQVLVWHAHLDEQEERIAKPLPELQGVPVAFPGGGGMRITWPLAVGDSVLLVFASSSIARWKATGREGDPGDDRRQDLNDAIAIPGLHDFAHVPTPAPTDAIVTHGLTKLGGPDATKDVVVQSALDTFITALTHAIGAAVPNDGGHAALTDLKTQLGAWAAGTTLTKAK